MKEAGVPQGAVPGRRRWGGRFQDRTIGQSFPPVSHHFNGGVAQTGSPHSPFLHAKVFMRRRLVLVLPVRGDHTGA